MQEAKQTAKDIVSGKLSPADEAALQATISGWNLQQLEGVDKKLLGHDKIGPYVPAERIEQAAKSDKFVQQDIDNIVKAHFAPLRQALDNFATTGRVDASEVRKEIKALSNKEIEMLGTLLRDKDVVNNLSPGQHETIKKSTKINSDVKQFIKTVKSEFIDDAIKSTTPGRTIGDIIINMSPSAVAQIDEKWLTNPAVVRHFSKAILNAIAKEGVNERVRDEIRAEIARQVAARTAPSKLGEAHAELTRPGSVLNNLF